MANELVTVAKVWSAYAIWHRTGSRAMGRVLIAALGSRDETVAGVAGTLLSRGGNAPRAVPLLMEAVANRQSMPHALVVLASQDFASTAQAKTVMDVVAGFVSDPDPEIANVATLILREEQQRGLS